MPREPNVIIEFEHKQPSLLDEIYPLKLRLTNNEDTQISNVKLVSLNVCHFTFSLLHSLIYTLNACMMRLTARIVHVYCIYNHPLK